jgi:hypothetical protein
VSSLIEAWGLAQELLVAELQNLVMGRLKCNSISCSWVLLLKVKIYTTVLRTFGNFPLRCFSLFSIMSSKPPNCGHGMLIDIATVYPQEREMQFELQTTTLTPEATKPVTERRKALWPFPFRYVILIGLKYSDLEWMMQEIEE